jgi:putative oxidoreductase
MFSRFRDQALLIFRVFAGLMFSFHGMQKVLGVMAEFQPPVASQLWIGGLLELVLGLLIAAGAWTTWAAFLASGMMAVAYVQFHWKLQFGSAFLPSINKGELALLYCVSFFLLMTLGAGRYSVDAKFLRR